MCASVGDGRLYITKKAPGPDNVNWSSLWCSRQERMQRRVWGGLFFAFFIVFPMGAFTGALTSVRFLLISLFAALGCLLQKVGDEA
jgi:hypothetical protein